MTAITKEKIAELRAVSYAATPTPWRVQTDAIGGIHKGTVNIEECGRAIETVATYCGAYEGHGKSNADFIVAAVNALPELLDEIERLRASCVPVAGTIDEITKAVRNADMTFEREGGSSRHYVRECLLPSLDDVGLSVVRK